MFFDNQEAEHYLASVALYEALELTDSVIPQEVIQPYEDLYANRESATTAELNAAAAKLKNNASMSAAYIAPYWNEQPIYWECEEGRFGQNNSYTWALTNNSSTSGTYFERYINYKDITSSISATVVVDEPSVFVYSSYYNNGDGFPIINVYVDDVLVRSLHGVQCRKNTHFFEELPAGKHTIKWVVQGDKNCYFYYRVANAGVMASPLISVNLLEPGSLGTEVLYNTSHIKNVRRLKIKGEMNSDDWAKIKMMPYLQDLDLSEAVITHIPDDQFSTEKDTASLFLHKMVLPEGLQRIGHRAFYYSRLDSLVIPSTVTTVGENTFAYSHIRQLILPDNLTNFEGHRNNYGQFDRPSFECMYWLTNLKCPKNWEVIPYKAFYDCCYLKKAVLPEKLVKIDDYAFQYCNLMEIEEFPEGLKSIGNYAFGDCLYLNPKWNDGLQTIGEYAFQYCTAMTKLDIPENVSSIGKYAFRGCSNLEEITVPTPIYTFANNVFTDCNKLKTLRLNCPTVVRYSSYSGNYPIAINYAPQVDLIVPDIVVMSYKQDSYWYNFKSINGFNTEEIQDWVINNPLVLNRERFGGTPNIVISADLNRLPSLKINGDNPQVFNDLKFRGYCENYYWNYPGQILSNCNNVSVKGTARVDLYTYEKKWQFFCLPFDVKVSDIYQSVNNAQVAIRYYDGANRAANGKSGSWKNFAAEDTIPAGTGFIMQSNVSAWNYFPSCNETKQNVVANKELVTTLSEHPAEVASNQGWNLVGNPWQCFYNIHMLNFTAPITVWNPDNNTYVAYSITDDDYAIRPNEAFFVQCPDAENNTIGFPTQGRQLNAVILSQNAVAPAEPATNLRQLVDLTLSNGDMEDRTRVVLNEEASIAYEVKCDAGKMMSMETLAPQIFTLGEDGTPYAINERPMGEGTVQLGYYAGAAGTYTIALQRCQAEKVCLTDYETGETVDLTLGDYTFTSEAGQNTVRFALSFAGSEATGIEAVSQNPTEKPMVFSVEGKYMGHSLQGLTPGVYVLRTGNKAQKVVVK
ncbi:leucine-rich repeat domain-containing protein [bacterium]|nr:leucine-rich repeat domain-containing protein [bacterium]